MSIRGWRWGTRSLVLGGALLGASVCALGGLGCGSTRTKPVATDPGKPSKPSSTGVTAEQAQSIARQLADREGYDVEVYQVVSCEQEGDRWQVDFEHAPPTPPGGHFTVYIDAQSGETELMRGE